MQQWHEDHFGDIAEKLENIMVDNLSCIIQILTIVNPNDSRNNPKKIRTILDFEVIATMLMIATDSIIIAIVPNSGTALVPTTSIV